MYSNTEKKKKKDASSTKKDSSHLFALVFSLKTFDGFSFSEFPTYANKIVSINKRKFEKKRKKHFLLIIISFIFKPKKH
jgi:hypothetical protein